jgi:SAM-dependent methyltransferase
VRKDFSAKKIFSCPTCQIPFSFSNDEQIAKCEKCGFLLIYEEAVWANPKLMDDKSINYCRDIDYVKRASNPFTTTARETLQYNRYLKKLLSSINPGSYVLDLGCGDGRFTQYFLDNGLEKIIAVDIDLHNLRRLASRLSSEEKEKVILIHADASKLPIKEGGLDAIFALGILNVLANQLLDVCTHLHNLLAYGGILVNSEPTLEGSLLYALIRQDFEEFFTVATTYTKTVDYDGDRSKRYAVFEHGKVEAVLSQSGFLVQDVKGVSVFPSLIFGGVLQMNEYDEDLKAKLVTIVDDLSNKNIPVFRVKMYLSQKGNPSTLSSSPPDSDLAP